MNLTKEQLAEQAGHAECASLLEMMRSCKTQGGRLTMLHACLVEMSQSENFEYALAGFSVALLMPLERGLGLQ